MSTLNYWAHRLMPLHDPTPGYTPDGTKDVQPGKDVVFIACNRVGTERGKSFLFSFFFGFTFSEPIVVNRMLTKGRYLISSRTARGTTGTTFVGTSCVMSISSSPSGIDLIEAMGSKEEGVMFALIN